jgi:hypothetical protein
MGLSPVTSAVSNFGKNWVRWRNFCDTSDIFSGTKHELYELQIVNNMETAFSLGNIWRAIDAQHVRQRCTTNIQVDA